MEGVNDNAEGVNIAMMLWSKDQLAGIAHSKTW